MTEEFAPDLRPTEDFTVHVALQVPRDVFKALRWDSEARRTTAGRMASAIVGAYYGADLATEPEEEPARPRISAKATQDDIRSMVEAGLSLTDIAGNLDVTKRTAANWLTALGLEPGQRLTGGPVRGKEYPNARGGAAPKVFSDQANVEKFLLMHSLGKSDIQIAQALGCVPAAVRRQRKMRGMLPNSTAPVDL